MKKYQDQIIRFLPALAVVVVFLVYCRTLLPGVGYSGDTAKFQFVGKVLGTPHEPGSPTYVMLNFLFVTLVPLGTLAFRANLLSALCSAGALFVVSRTLLLLGVRRWIAAVVVLVFGFTYTLWSQSVIAEVYALNILFVALTLHFFLRWYFHDRYRDFLVACAVYAISFGDHLLVVTFLPAIIYLVWRRHKEYFRTPRVIFEVLLLILLGAAQYGYLIWRTYAHETSYLEIAVPDLRTLWFYASGGQFHSYFFVGGFGGFFFVGAPIVLRLIWLEYLLLFPVSLMGYFALQDSGARRFLLLGLLCVLLFTILYAIADIFVYLLPVYLILALLLGLGFEWMAARLAGQYRRSFGVALSFIPVLFFLLNVNKADQSLDVKAAKIVENSLKAVSGDALIVCPNYDYAEYFWYYQFAEEGGAGGGKFHTVFSHEAYIPFYSIQQYIEKGKPLALEVERRLAPRGFTVYYCTAYQPRAYDEQRTRYPASRNFLEEYRRSFIFFPMLQMMRNGFQFVPVADQFYRIEKPVQ